MTDPTPLDKLLADLPVGRAPVAPMVRAGRTRRRKRRMSVLAAVGAVTVVALVAAIASAGPDRQHPVRPSEPDRTDAAATLTVQVRLSDRQHEDDPGAGWASWDPTRLELTYVSTSPWSSSCLPDGTATETPDQTALTLDGGQPGVICTTDGRRIAAVVEGVTVMPANLRVTERGRTLTVPVNEAGTTYDALVVTSVTPGNEATYPEGTVTEVSFDSTRATGNERVTVGPGKATWQYGTGGRLIPNSYRVIAYSRPCRASTCAYNEVGRPTDRCERQLDLVENVTIRIDVTHGRACTIEVESGISERAVPLLSSGWRPGNTSLFAGTGGTLRRDASDCVFLQAGPKHRTLVAWPEGWTAAAQPDGQLLLRNPEGEIAAREGDQLEVGGGAFRVEGDRLGACDDGKAHELFLIQSEVDVVSR